MGSKKPKWLIKLQRKKLTEARLCIARAKNPGTKNLGVRHLGRHGGMKKGQGV